MTDPISKKTLHYAQIWHTVVFEVAVYELAIRLSKFKMSVTSSKEA